LVDERYVGQSGPCAVCGKTVTVAGSASAASLAVPHSATRLKFGIARTLLVSLASIVVIALLAGGVMGFVYLAITTSDVVRTGTLQDPCAANLAAIGKAMLQYHNDNGRFPPAAVLDAQGRPLHSWRVLLLPYLGQAALFQQYNMSKPWDDPQNQRLAAQMPAVYHCPDSFNVASSETSYMVVAGPETVFHGRESASLHEIHDGAARTLLVVETTGNAINWLEPRDLSQSSLSLAINGANSAGIGSNHKPGGAHVLLADGTVTFLGNLTSPETLEALLTIDAADAPAE
jgi:hypothetical protein